MTNRLKLMRDNRTVAEYPLIGDKILIGRANECQIRIKDDHVGREQAVLIREQGKYAVEDHGRKNPSRLNGSPIIGRTFLNDGDHISFSGYTLLFRCAGPSPAQVGEEDGLTLLAAIDASDAGSSVVGASASAGCRPCSRCSRPSAGPWTWTPCWTLCLARC